jgi:hypothetical protein
MYQHTSFLGRGMKYSPKMFIALVPGVHVVGADHGSDQLVRIL